MKISAIVITFNEEENIRGCLESLEWTDEIIVVDSKSKDNTINIAKEYTNKIFTADNIPYGEKRNLGIKNSESDWILWVDADERVTEKLKNEVLDIINDPGNKTAAFYIKRKSFFINKFIKHSGWYPDYTLRLFKRSTGIKFDSAKVHEKALYSGKTGKLRNDILHFTDKDFEHYVNKLNIYTTLSAEEMHNGRRKSSVFDIIFRPAFTFFKMYFLKLGILDGYIGLVLSALSSIHVMVKYQKLYYLNKKQLTYGR